MRTDPRFELLLGQSTSIPSHGSGGGSGQDRSVNYQVNWKTVNIKTSSKLNYQYQQLSLDYM